MSSNAIKAGEAYVSIFTRDDGVQSGLNKMQQGSINPFLRAIKRASAETLNTTAAAAAEAARRVAGGLTAQRRELQQKSTSLAKGATPGAISQEHAGVLRQIAALDQQITAALAQQTELLNQQQAADAQHARQQQIRLQRSRDYTQELQRQAALQQQEAGTGAAHVSRALGRAGAAQQVSGLSTVAEATRLQTVLEQQRNTLNGQVAALMAEVKELRQAGASEAARAPLTAKVRELIAQRKQVEEQINAVMARRAGIQSSEAAQAAAAVQQQATALGAYNRSAGLSEATTKRFHLSLTNANRAVGQARAGFSGAAGGMGRFNQVGSQVAFLADDLMAGYGMGGVAGALRATSNNVQMLLLPFGGWVALAGTAVMIGAQLVMAFNKKGAAAKEAAQNTDLMTAALDRLVQKEEFLAKLKRETSLGSLTSQTQDKQTDLEAAGNAAAKLKAEREAQEANVARLSRALGTAQFSAGDRMASRAGREAGDTQDQLQAQLVAARQKVAEVAEKEAEQLERQAQLKEEIAAIDERRRKLSDQEIARLNQEQRLLRETREINRSYLANQQEREKEKVLKKFDEKVQEELHDMRKEIVREINPQRGERNEILEKMFARLDLAKLTSDPRQRMVVETEIKQSALKQLQQLEKNSPSRAIEHELFSELGQGRAGQRKAILERSRDRGRAIRDDINLSPERRDQLLEATARSQALQLAGTFSADRKAHASVANTAVEARSAEGIRAVLAATTGRKTVEEKLLEKAAQGQKMSADQLKKLEEMLNIWRNATPITATPAGA